MHLRVSRVYTKMGLAILKLCITDVCAIYDTRLCGGGGSVMASHSVDEPISTSLYYNDATTIFGGGTVFILIVCIVLFFLYTYRSHLLSLSSDGRGNYISSNTLVVICLVNLDFG